ncbi:MAG: hypothetical protein KGH63_02840 [Candidatus Micrarchaeota archaeon]|nr:hypothetical protein [Candidatus Micrarchaeota archaeon]
MKKVRRPLEKGVPTPPAFSPSLFSSFISRVRALSDYRIAMALIAACAALTVCLSPPALQLAELSTLLLGLLFAILAQALIDWLSKRPIAFSDGATVSGLIIGSVLAPGTPALLVAAVAALAMLLKRLVRFRGVPVFNPAGLGLLLGSLLLGTHAAWWAGLPSPPLLPLLAFSILFISWKLRKLLLQAAFVLVWSLLWIFSGTSLPTLLSLTPFFLMAFMLIEHTTSPSRPAWRQAAYGALVAVLGFALIQSALPLEAMLIALLAGNAFEKTMAALSRK